MLAGEAPLTVPQPDITKPFPHPALIMWLYGYDATAEANLDLEKAL